MSERNRYRQTTAALFAVYAVSQVNIARLLLPLGRDVARLQSTADATVFREVMGGWTPAQREQYRRHLGPDTVHPLLYAAALIAAGRAVQHPAQSRWVKTTLIVAPAISALCDVIENAFHARFCASPQDITPRAAAVSGAATRTKWVLALGSAIWISAQAGQRRRRRS